jgi:hypothetical protein
VALPLELQTTKVSQNGQTPVSVCRGRPGGRYPHTSYLHIPHSFGRAACVVGDQAEAHAQPVDGPEQAPQPIGLHVLRVRAGITFSGNTGTVVVSGEPGVTSAPTYQLVDDITTVIKEQPNQGSSALIVTRRESPLGCSAHLKVGPGSNLAAEDHPGGPGERWHGRGHGQGQ